MELELWEMWFNYCLEKWFIQEIISFILVLPTAKREMQTLGKQNQENHLFFFT